MPPVEISERSKLRITLFKGRKDLARQVEAEEHQLHLREESLDLRQSVSVFHHIKKQITTATRAVEVIHRGEALRDAIFDVENFLTASTNSLRGRGIVALFDQLAASVNGTTCYLAVKADTH